ncbi:MAG TPA: sulfatase [Candidatus Hydrogenedentes bacterium]|nr:sulfatase [Candidatus Hydrogenedentota bacterium]
MNRRAFMQTAAIGLASTAVAAPEARKRPNLVFVFADQWRAQATGYAGDVNVRTPHLDRLASESINCRNAISGWPVCSPYRGSLITGQYPHTHGIFLNDVPLGSDAVSFANALKPEGYATGYIGKWHIDGHGRSNYIPKARQQGFDFWRVLECTHDYNKSFYYADDNPEKKLWDGYDAIAQTREAQRYIREQAGKGPFALFLSWGPPHDPYETAPPEYKAMYDAARISIRDNVPTEHEAWARRVTAGYYAHCSVLDTCTGDLVKTLEESGIAADTIFVFTSDHGDMLGSHGETHKQRPWDESIRVPFLIRYPRAFGNRGRTCDMMLNSVDLMPTLLGLCGVPIPATVEGRDRSRDFTQSGTSDDDAALLACYSPFGQWTRAKGGREFRGVRTQRYTYTRSLNGPWLLYDNKTDPYQLANLCNVPGYEKLQRHLDALLNRKLDEANDAFLPGEEYVKRFGYATDPSGTVSYTP